MTEAGHKLAALAVTVAVVMAVLSGGTTFAVLSDAESVTVEFDAGNTCTGNCVGAATIGPVLFASPGEFEMWAGVRTVSRREREEG